MSKYVLISAECGKGALNVQEPFARVLTKPLRVRSGVRRLRLAASRLEVHKKRSRASDEGRTKRGSRTGGVGSEWICGDNLFSRGSNLEHLIAIVSKVRTLAKVIHRRDTHNVRQARRVDHLALPSLAREAT
jgi:hypothetical protein